MYFSFQFIFWDLVYGILFPFEQSFSFCQWNSDIPLMFAPSFLLFLVSTTLLWRGWWLVCMCCPSFILQLFLIFHQLNNQETILFYNLFIRRNCQDRLWTFKLVDWNCENFTKILTLYAVVITQDCSLAKRSITNNESPLEFKHSDIKHQLHFISKHICDQMQ